MAVIKFTKANINNFFDDLTQPMVFQNQIDFEGIGYWNMGTRSAGNSFIIEAGSAWETGGQYFTVDADFSFTITTTNYVYCNGTTLSISTTVPAWNSAKRGYYSGNNRALMKVEPVYATISNCAYKVWFLQRSGNMEGEISKWQPATTSEYRTIYIGTTITKKEDFIYKSYCKNIKIDFAEIGGNGGNGGSGGSQGQNGSSGSVSSGYPSTSGTSGGTGASGATGRGAMGMGSGGSGGSGGSAGTESGGSAGGGGGGGGGGVAGAGACGQGHGARHRVLVSTSARQFEGRLRTAAASSAPAQVQDAVTANPIEGWLVKRMQRVVICVRLGVGIAVTFVLVV
ncbi:MAG: hypothetical protein LBJ41_01880 [Treponema sp.]|jgi:hypothetical protein|nr:hypothetical protein [Treponema sp.]